MADSLNTIFISLKQAQAKLAAENRAGKDKALAAAAIDGGRADILKANAYFGVLNAVLVRPGVIR